MADIVQVGKAVCDFLKGALNVKDVKVVKVTRTDDGWKTESEVYEESSFIKALGLSTKVQDRNFYEVRLNDGLQVEAYGRLDGYDKSE